MASPSRLLALRLSLGLVPLGPAAAHAATGDEVEPSPETEAGAQAKGVAAGGAAPPPPLSKRTDSPWIQRWSPERGVIEVGAFGGVLVPARDLELFEPRPGEPSQGFLPLASVAPDFGLRASYFPLRVVGAEAEGALMPTRTQDAGDAVTLWALRGHAIGQLPGASITPFVVAGVGAMAIRGGSSTLGNDVDPAFHLGIGAKVFINRYVMARLDLRDEITPRSGEVQGATNSIEVLLGVSVTLGRLRDRDEPSRPTAQPEPEPVPAPADTDEDGFLDNEDHCPEQAGIAPDGCPPPPDGDEDGFADEDDRCPQEAGIAPDGCPDTDADGDGMLAPADACPAEAETVNGFEDTDGCPDEIPEAIQRLRGALGGVDFEGDTATLTAAARAALEPVAALLVKHPSVRVELSGHMDNAGGREASVRRSQQRADAVRDYLVEQGVDADRITTRGAGPDEPIDSNATAEGRANNRRVEIRVR